jgi:hypothetical protein
MGIAQQGLKSAGANDSLERYLTIRGKSTEDVLVSEARRNLSLSRPAEP